MNVDFSGAAVVCKCDITEFCKPRDLCDLCGLDCSLEKLLPYGIAWAMVKLRPQNPLSVCEPIDKCPPCEPKFFESWFKYRAKIAQGILSSALNLFQDLSPLTSKEPSYWLKHYGIDKICNGFKSDDCAEKSNCNFCNKVNCKLNDDAQKAVDYNILRFYLRITRNDFAQNQVQWNEALKFLGLSLVINNEQTCPVVRDGYTYQEPIIEQFININPVRDGLTYSENVDCKIEILRFKLVRNFDEVMPAPTNMCELNPCDKEGGLIVCAPIGNKPMIKITANIDGCGIHGGMVYDPAKEMAYCLLKRFWLVSQPVEITL